jgi:hypothetical protein
VAGCCECGDEPSSSCATELVSFIVLIKQRGNFTCIIELHRLSQHIPFEGHLKNTSYEEHVLLFMLFLHLFFY